MQNKFFMVWISAIFIAMAQPAISVAKDRKTENLSQHKIASLIRAAQSRLSYRESQYWAFDLVWVMDKSHLIKRPENICAMIAVINQESNFAANPSVAGLGRKATRKTDELLGRVPVFGGYLKKKLGQLPSKSYSFKRMLRQSRTERDLDRIYRKMVGYVLGRVRYASVLKNTIEGYNQIDTIGSMQTSVAYAVRLEERRRRVKLNLKQIEQLRDWMYSRRGGIFYGANLLLNYKTDYRRKIHRFADYNAGRYASRNAAFQFMINKVAHSRLALDGDLLRYNAQQKPSWFVSNTEKMIHKIVKKYHIRGLRRRQIRADLLQEKKYLFTRTKTYRRLTRLYRRKTGKTVIRAIIPKIRLHSIKFSRLFTTRLFAQRVYGRYRSCMGQVR